MAVIPRVLKTGLQLLRVHVDRPAHPANALAVLALGIAPAPLMDLCARAITASL